jgi:hypothetical protein
MNEPIAKKERHSPHEPKETQKVETIEKAAWETPKMQDVSEQVMAQPYIRFT